MPCIVVWLVKKPKKDNNTVKTNDGLDGLHHHAVSFSKKSSSKTRSIAATTGSGKLDVAPAPNDPDEAVEDDDEEADSQVKSVIVDATVPRRARPDQPAPPLLGKPHCSKNGVSSPSDLIDVIVSSRPESLLDSFFPLMWWWWFLSRPGLN
jgi:hypothetical protein